MITVIPYENLGHGDHGWLNARHHFSFASYRNPQRMGFGTIRVINDDVIQAGKGFDTHPHNNMEIITYVRKGAISHKDSNGNSGRTIAGDVQVMSAGTGIYHSEFNLENEDTNLYQIWIEPNQMEVTPRWDSHEFPQQPVDDQLKLLVSGNNDGPLMIYQDARIYAGRLLPGTKLKHAIVHQAYVLVSDGELTIDDVKVKKGDGVEVTDQGEINISADVDAEILLIDAP